MTRPLVELDVSPRSDLDAVVALVVVELAQRGYGGSVVRIRLDDRIPAGWYHLALAARTLEPVGWDDDDL